ncbi:hypothetical protein [Autumnicola musiva]|uniref:Lipocalin-like domain-containing protein n=1 Tax=Autumnicola musiva TaxID=3075589 RepID=A0ABU3D825_9FLAO|nr:hypothetical protein [Zunongwangia sp. F117]MDT0677686.1 hypothetical protein [Zunongwangia sp. F117]
MKLQALRTIEGTIIKQHGMKRVLIIFIFCSLSLGCSSDDTAQPSKIALHPPEWLQGSWKQYELCGSLCHELEISEDNIKIITWGGANVFDLLNTAKNSQARSNASASIEENIVSENKYEFIFTTFEGEMINYRMKYNFILLDSTTVSFSQNSYEYKMKKF